VNVEAVLPKKEVVGVVVEKREPVVGVEVAIGWVGLKPRKVEGVAVLKTEPEAPPKLPPPPAGTDKG